MFGVVISTSKSMKPSFWIRAASSSSPTSTMRRALFGVLAAATAPQPPARPETPAAQPRKTPAPRPGLRYAQITLAAVVAMALCAPLSRALLWFLF